MNKFETYEPGSDGVMYPHSGGDWISSEANDHIAELEAKPDVIEPQKGGVLERWEANKLMDFQRRNKDLEAKLAALEVTLARVKWWQSLNKMLVCYQSHIEHRTKLDSLLSAVPEVLDTEYDLRCGQCGGDEMGKQDTAGVCKHCKVPFVPVTVTVQARKEKP